MTRGLGKIQVEILDNLDKAMSQQPPEYRGAGQEPGWICHRRLTVQLHQDIYDLKAVLFFLAEKNGKMVDGRIDKDFKYAFSKAVRALVRRKKLESLWLIPLVAWRPEDEGRLLQLEGNTYLWTSERQRRFVRIPPDYQVFASGTDNTLFVRQEITA